MKTRATALFALLIVVCISSTFASTLFKSASISRFDLISMLDVLANPSLQGAGLSVGQDPSACLQSIPKEFFVRQSLAKGWSPIWNPLSGCGQPLIADPANTTWSPLDILFGPNNQNIYNIGIVVKIILGGILAFFLFLTGGASPWAACTAAMGFALSARVLRGVELATNFEMLPGVFLIFQLLKAKASWKQIGLSAIGLALCYTALHPEVFFIGTISASFIWLCVSALVSPPHLCSSPPHGSNSSSDSPLAASGLQSADASPNTSALQSADAPSSAHSCRGDAMRRPFVESVLTIIKLALLTLLMVSPLLLPFLEYLNFAHSYKYDGSSVEFIPLAQLPVFISVPKLAGTLFPGWVVLLGMPLGLLRVWKERPVALIVLLLLILFACRPAPLDAALSHPPFSYLLPEYALGTILLLLCQFAANGLTDLNQLSKSPILQRLGIGGFSLLVAVLPIVLICRDPAMFGLQASISNKVLLSSIIIASASALLILSVNLAEQTGVSLSSSPKRIALLCLVMLALPVLNLSSLVAPARAELPVTRKVPLPPEGREQLIREMQSVQNARITACGAGLMPANTSLLYGLDDLRTNSPLNNTRYLKFMSRAGAKIGYCNMMEVPSQLSKLIDLASVNLILSSVPPRSSESATKKNASTNATSISGRIMPGMRLVEAICAYSPSSAEISVVLKMRVHENLGSRYHAQVVLVDDKNKVVWRGATNVLSAESSSSTHDASYDWLIPAPLMEGRAINVSPVLEIYDSWTGNFICPDGINSIRSNSGEASIKTSSTRIALANYTTQQIKSAESLDGRFKLLFETPDLLRVYQNIHSLPRAYIVHHIVDADSGDHALDKIAEVNFDAKQDAVVENAGSGFPSLGTANSKPDAANHEAQNGSAAGDASTSVGTNTNEDKVEILKRENTGVDIKCSTNSAGLMVLSDIFYPGWQATVDGVSAEIYQTNYLFRGVLIQPGTHLVSFRFAPFSFNLGLLGLFLSIMFVLWACLRSSKSELRK